MKRFARFAGVSAVLMVGVGCGDSQSGLSSGLTGPTPVGIWSQGTMQTVDVAALNSTEREFIALEAMLHQAEIELGERAEAQADLPEVKFFGRQMVQDHTAALLQLRSMAREAVPGNLTMPQSHQQQVAELSRLSGSEFDRLYVPAMIASHEQALAMLGQMLPSFSSTVLRNHAQEMQQSVTQHLEMARDVATRVGTR